MGVDIKDEYNLKVSYKVVDYTLPKIVYITIAPTAKVYVKVGDKVLKDQLLAEIKTKKYYSSISGTIIGFCKVKDHNNKNLPAIAIKNNFKEQSKKIKIDYNNVEQWDLKLSSKLKTLKDCTLIVNALEDEPYIANNILIIRDYCEKILKTLDKLANDFNLSKVVIIIGINDKDSINKLWNSIGRYPNITVNLIDSDYTNSCEIVLAKKVKKHYSNFKIISLYDVLKVYNYFINNTLVSQKYMTISGRGVQKPKVINIKYGTPLIQAINDNIKIKKDLEYHFITNGLMKGKEVDLNLLCMNENIDGIIIQDIKSYLEKPCINCGLCAKFCPIGLDPKYLKENKKYSNKCIHCNLCSYICPSHIDFSKYLKKEAK